jgi:hypothetical protein
LGARSASSCVVERGLAEGVAGAGQVAALLADRAQQCLGLGALGQGFVVELIRARLAVVGQHLGPDPVQHVQPAHRLQLLAQVAQHVGHQGLGLVALVAGDLAGLQGGDGHRAHGQGTTRPRW